MSLYRLHLRSGYPEAEAPAVEPLTNPADVGLGGVVFQDDGTALRTYLEVRRRYLDALTEIRRYATAKATASQERYQELHLDHREG